MAIRITAQPKNVTARVGDVIYFTVAAEGEGLTYQWQFRTATSSAWIDTTMVSGYNTPTIKINATANTDGNSYRCVITDANGNTVTSYAATLYVAAIAISAQPTSAAVYIGDVIYFTVAAEGEGLTYQWQFRTATSGAWIDTTMVSGYNTPTIKINATANTDGNSYRCAITDANGNTVTSDAATLYLVDGTLSAGKGFMPMSIMSDIAKAIREKTESTGMILPAEMAAMIEGIKTGVLPWATEYEAAQVTVAADTTTLNVPCNMTAAPTGHLIMMSRRVSTSSMRHFSQLSFDWQSSTSVKDWSAVFDYNSSYDPTMPDSRDFGTVTLENGIAKFTVLNGYKWCAGDTYNIIMWR